MSVRNISAMLAELDGNGGGDDDDPMNDSLSDAFHVRASIALFDPSAVLASLQQQNNDLHPLSSLNEDHEEVEEEKEREETATAAGGKQQRRQQRPRQPRRESLLKNTLTQTFAAHEEKTVLKVLGVIQQIEDRQYNTNGFKESKFTAGVINCFLVAYAFGKYPEHFWIVYLVESLYFIPSKFRHMVQAKPLNEALYYLDFCWMMNFSFVLFLVLGMTQALPLTLQVRQLAARGIMGIACGPLLGATAILPFVAFVFHDVNSMTNVVIHLLPPMLVYTMRWHAPEIRDAWPLAFSQLDHLQQASFFPNNNNRFPALFVPGTNLECIAGTAVFIYILWWIPYTSWMLLVGMDLPRKNKTNHTPKYDTVFHSFWRAGACQTFGTLAWKRPVATSQEQMANDDFEVRDFLLYMVLHAAMALTSIPTLAWLCHTHKHVHVGLILLVLLACVHRGSQRYTYYTTKMYSRMVRREFLPRHQPSMTTPATAS